MMTSLLPLALAPLGIWLVSPTTGSGTAAPWSWPRELGLAAVVGALFAALCGLWLARFYLIGDNFLCSDFHEYCSSVSALAMDEPERFTKQRSAAAALPAALISRHTGLIDGMAWAGLLSSGLIGAGLYLWGRAAHSRLAGISAALSAATMMPVVVMSRTLSLYDEMTGWFVLGGAGAAVAWRQRSPGALFFAGIGVGLAGLADFRGLFWAVSYLGLGLVAAIWPAPGVAGLGRRLLRTVLNLTAFVLPVIYAWRLGPWAYRFNISLEEVMNPRQRFVEWGFTDPALTAPFRAESAFIWGSSPPEDIPKTILWVMRETAVIPREAWDTDDLHRLLAEHVTPWTPLWVAACALTALSLLRGPERFARLVVVFGAGVPFFMAFKGAVELQRAQLHYLGSSMPVFAVWMGVAWASLCEGAAPSALSAPLERLRGWIWAPLSRWPRLAEKVLPSARGVLGVGFLALFVLGVLPSLVSPQASWRRRWAYGEGEILTLIGSAARGVDPIRANIVDT
ncbi:hypothetical protein L6R46_29175 [Myxococcota bacterium]|nr:hypothetical protein [Myxococcota bacterium]